MKTTDFYNFVRNFCKSNGIPVAKSYTEKDTNSITQRAGNKRYVCVAFSNLTQDQIDMLEYMVSIEDEMRFSTGGQYSSYGHYIRATAEL